MAHELDSTWETSTGLPLDGATVTIAAAVFGFNDHFPGKPCFNVTFLNEEDQQTYDQSFTVGSQGRPSADGQQLADPPRKMNAQSNFGRLIAAAKELIGDGIGGIVGNAFIARDWVGTRWVLGTVERKGVMNPETGTTKDSRPLTFVQFLGKGDVPATARAGGGGVGGAATATVQSQAADANPMFDQLVTYANTACNGGPFPDHDTFLGAVLEAHPEVEKDAALRKAVYQEQSGTSTTVWAAALAARN